MTIDPANLGSVDPHSVEGIFLVALSKSGSERDAFLSVQCVDPLQRQRVEGLLQAYEQAGNFLQKPAVAAEATPIGQYLEQCALPGTLGKLGPYEILEEIGRGGMGVVFRAHDPKLQRIVAVKALAPELARLPSARQRFLREARAAAAVSHPHVVTIFAVEGTEEASLGTERTTLPYLVMECIVGQTLHDKIKRVGALKVEEIVRISRQIAEGLTAAHKRGLNPAEEVKTTTTTWWNSQLPDIAAISFMLAMLQGAIYPDVADVEPFLTGLLVWAAAYLFRYVCKCGRWINRQHCLVSLLAIIRGGALGVLIRQRGGSIELGAPIFVFGSAGIIFWLLARWFPQLFIQNRSPQPNTSASTFSEVAAGQQSASAAVRPRTPWVILEWVIVVTLGIAVLSSLGFATVWIMSYLPAPGEITPYATCVIRTPVAENVKYVTVDGKQAILEPGGPGEWRTTTDPGTHGIYVAYDSDSVLNQERFFTTTVTAERGKATIITAEPVMVRSLTRPPGIEASPAIPELDRAATY